MFSKQRLAILSSLFFLLSFLPFSSASAQTSSNCLPSDLLLVVDHSCSMTEPIGAITKWGAAQQAYRTLLTTYANSARYGLVMFSQQASLRVGVGPNTAAQCLNALNSVSPSGTTAIECALQVSVQHYTTTVIPNDPVKDRRRFVVLMTDGIPNVYCPAASISESDTTSQLTRLVPQVKALRAINIAGQTYDVKTYVIGFGSGVSPTVLQRLAQEGGTGNYIQADNLAQLQAALTTIIQGATKEICDNKDNDCDGIIDNFTENCQGPCGQGTRTCQSGQWTTCTAARQPSPEICNNQDDNCDGKTDEDLSRPCQNACGKGIEVCQKGQWTGCTAPTPKTEDCNGKDDDCDGLIDEGLSRPCQTQCGPGTQACIQGDWTTCSAPQPQTEICDGLDNNCNGQVDEGDLCQGGKCINGTCYRTCTAECPAGQICGNDGLCRPRPCSPDCQAGQTCRSGRCVPTDCTQPGGECAQGDLCIQQTCKKNLCLGVTCATGQFCRPSDGKCQHSCSLVTCAAGQSCQNGVCVGDPCSSVSCPAGQACQNGQCIPSTCTASSCATGQACIGGRCQDDPCYGIQCPANQRCIQGQCYSSTGPLPPPDGSVNPGPDGSVNPGPDGSVNPGPDGSVNPGPDGSTTNDGKTSGNTNDEDPNNPPGGRTTGCVCSSTGPLSHLPFGFLLVLLILPFVLRRWHVE